MADPVTPCPLRAPPPLRWDPQATPLQVLTGLATATPSLQLPADYSPPPSAVFAAPDRVLTALPPPVVSNSSVFSFLTGGSLTGPLTSPRVISAPQTSPKFVEIGHLVLSQFAGDLQGFAAGPVVGGVLTPHGVKLSFGMFLNIPPVGSGVVAWRL